MFNLLSLKEEIEKVRVQAGTGDGKEQGLELLRTEVLYVLISVLFSCQKEIINL